MATDGVVLMISREILSDIQPSLQHTTHRLGWLSSIRYCGCSGILHTYNTKQSTENQWPLRSELHQRVEGSRLNPYGELPHNSHWNWLLLSIQS